MKKSIIIISLIAVCGAAVFAGCSNKKNDLPTTTTLTTAQATSETTNKAEEALTKAGENASEALSDAGDAVGEAASGAGGAVSKAGEAVKDGLK